MKKVIIIGGGFAGLRALERLSKYGRDLELTLIDKKPTFDFLPALPDIVGERIQPRFLSYSLDEAAGASDCRFINDEVTGLDLAKKRVVTSSGSYTYDYLLIASGSQTNFYGNDQMKRYAAVLDSVEDAKKILERLEADRYDAFVLGGGGYTGVEIATNLWRFFARRKISKRIVIVERASSILGPLPVWIKEYISANLKRLGIEVLTDTTAEEIKEDSISLSNGRSFKKAMFFWAAGVKTSDYISRLDIDKDRQGRITVDEYLRYKDSCFVAGDAAHFLHKGHALRMSVQYAITESVHAADNLVRSMGNRPLQRFTPVDLGYMVPMANNASCGQALGIPVRGVPGILLHYFFCTYRSYGIRNRWGIIKNIVGGVR